MRVMCRTFVLLAILLIAVSACGGGSSYSTVISTSFENGEVDVPTVGMTFSITFDYQIDAATVTESTFFMVKNVASESEQSASVIDDSYDEVVCNVDNALGAEITCGEFQCLFVPTTSLKGNANYAICLTPDIEYACVSSDYACSPNSFLGMTIHFRTETTALAETPTFSLEEGTYYDSRLVELSTATEGADIYYTIDGTVPNELSTLYSEAIELDVTTTIKAVSSKASLTDSEIATAEYIIKNVYVAFSEKNHSGIWVAKYWKNDEAVELTGGSTIAFASAIFVSGTDVYVAGSEHNGSKYVAKYWKNGVAVELSGGITDARASSISVSGSNVYVSGFVINEDSKYVATYWENGVAKSLSDGTNNAFANSLFASGSDVYIAVSEDGVAKYWGNDDVMTSLTDGTKDASAKGVFVSGADVYVAGYEENGSTEKAVPKYWKNNDEEIELSHNESNNVYADAIFVSEADVYVAGTECDDSWKCSVKYWKNGELTNLTEGETDAFTTINSIFVSGSDVYVAYVESNGSEYVAKYWKNNGEVTVLTEGDRQANMGGIFISE